MATPLERLHNEISQQPPDLGDMAFRRALKHVICFPLFSGGNARAVHYRPQRDQRAFAIPDQSPLDTDSLDAQLTERFYVDLWVPRDEVARVLSTLVEGNSLVVLTGEKGAGKSTLLQRVSLEMQENSKTFGIVADARRLDYSLSALRGDIRFDLCSSLYEVLFDELVRETKVRRAWHTFLLRTDSHFFALRTLGSSSDLPDLDHIIDSYAGEYDSALLLWNKERGIHKLRAILEFIRELSAKPLVLYVDNVDQYSNDFQTRVAEHLNTLIEQGVLESAVVTLRPENYSRVKASLDGLRFVTHIELDPLYGDHHTGEQIDDHSRASDNFFIEYLDRRLRFFSERLDQVLPAAGTVSDAHDAPHLARYRELLDTIREMSRTVNIYGQLTRWYNGSARAAAYSLLGLLRRIVSAEGAPLWRDGQNEAVLPLRLAREQRLVRSFVYRQMILDDDDTVLPPSAPMLYANDYPTIGSVEEVPFLELHLLKYLSDAPSRSYAQLCGHAAALSVASDRCQHAVLRLLEGRGIDETGLVHIDEYHPGLPIAEDAEIRVLRSGRYMNQFLASSCEYLFWSALAHNNGQRYLPSKDHKITALLQREDLRVGVATSFYRQWIAPTLLRYEAVLEDGDDGRRAVYRNHYRSDFIQHAIVSSLTGFIDRSPRLDPSDRLTLQRELTARIKR
jgi:energy-coupling factor transporter ATP-binding protein EcfA2